MFGFLQKITDPVCKMRVDKKETFSEYKGEKYYFCSENCKKKFDAEAEKYIAQKENVQPQSCCQQNSKSCC